MDSAEAIAAEKRSWRVREREIGGLQVQPHHPGMPTELCSLPRHGVTESLPAEVAPVARDPVWEGSRSVCGQWTVAVAAGSPPRREQLRGWTIAGDAAVCCLNGHIDRGNVEGFDVGPLP
jgi:hypothetical protein